MKQLGKNVQCAAAVSFRNALKLEMWRWMDAAL